jgi:hypothetical protein
MDKDEREGLPSASPWRRLELCAGSFQLEAEALKRGQAVRVESPQARTGDRIHDCLAKGRFEGLSESERETALLLMEQAKSEGERIFAGRLLEDTISLDLKKQNIEKSKNSTNGPVDRQESIEFSMVKPDHEPREYREIRFWLPIGGQKMASGRIDRLLVDGDLALIQDYKTGFAVPDRAERNAQLKFLAVVVALNFKAIQRVVVQLITGRYGVFEHVYDLAALYAAHESVLETIEKIRDPHAAFNPTSEGCRYCRAAAICDALKERILPVAREQLSELPSGKRAAQLLGEVELLENHLGAIRDFYTERLRADPSFEIPGWGLVAGRPKRTIRDWAQMRVRLENHIPAQQLDKVVSFTLESVEHLLGKALGLKGEKLKERFKELAGDLLEFKYPAPSLKRLPPSS